MRSAHFASSTGLLYLAVLKDEFTYTAADVATDHLIRTALFGLALSTAVKVHPPSKDWLRIQF